MVAIGGAVVVSWSEVSVLSYSVITIINAFFPPDVNIFYILSKIISKQVFFCVFSCGSQRIIISYQYRSSRDLVSERNFPNLTE